MSTFDAAWTAGYLAWNSEALHPTLDPQWGGRDNRLFRYAFNTSYVNGNPYGNSWSTAQKNRLGYYKYIRPILNPTAGLVELYVGEVYGGTIAKDLADGAIPVETENEVLRQQIYQLYQNSNWQSQKSLYVRFGAMLGDVAVKVVDNRDAMQVHLEVLHPAKIHSIQRDSKGDITYARIEYERGVINDQTGNIEATYIYREDITPDEFRTFKDDKPWAYFQDAIGRNVDNWRNDYGFVPLEVVQHRDVGLGWGASAFHHVLPQLDEINDGWSILNDNVRKAVNIMWFMKARKQTDTLSKSIDERDTMLLLWGGENAQDPYPMVPNIDISAAGQNILNMASNLENALPEYALHQVRNKGQMTAPGIRAGWSDAIDHIVEARGNYDGGLIRLDKMGVYIGAMMRYPGFEDMQYASLDDERLEHTIAERAVIEDQLTEKEQIDTLRNLPDKPEQARLVLDRLKVPKDVTDKIVAEIMQAMAEKRAQDQAQFGQPGNAQPDGNRPQLPAGQGQSDTPPEDDIMAFVDQVMSGVAA